MFKEAKALTILVETPLHAGSGSDLGIVDLPIQRERHTQHPKIEASSLKGCLREAFEGQYTHSAFENVEKDYVMHYINPVFGPDPELDKKLGIEKSDEHASALGVTDARLLLFPVKSMKGVFAWITCPAIINRLMQDLTLARSLGCTIPAPLAETDLAALPNTLPSGSQLFIKAGSSSIVLEEYTFPVTASDTCATLAQWLVEHILPEDEAFTYWRTKMAKDIVVLSDDDFCDFVTMSTEVITRTKINDDTGTVQSGALWSEEYLPADSVLYALVLTSDPRDLLKQEARQLHDAKAIMEFFQNGLGRAQHIFQLGGNATIGKGLVRAAMMR